MTLYRFSSRECKFSKVSTGRSLEQNPRASVLGFMPPRPAVCSGPLTLTSILPLYTSTHQQSYTYVCTCMQQVIPSLSTHTHAHARTHIHTHKWISTSTGQVRNVGQQWATYCTYRQQGLGACPHRGGRDQLHKRLHLGDGDKSEPVVQLVSIRLHQLHKVHTFVSDHTAYSG